MQGATQLAGKMWLKLRVTHLSFCSCHFSVTVSNVYTVSDMRSLLPPPRNQMVRLPIRWAVWCLYYRLPRSASAVEKGSNAFTKAARST